MSVVVGDQRPGDRGAGLVVVPDGGGHRQDPLGDADGDAFEGPPAVGFEVELAFEGVVDRFDQLADGFEQRLAGAGGLVFAGGPQQGGAAGGQAGFGFAAGEALVGDEDQAGPGGGEVGLDVEHGGQHLAFADLRVGQCPQDRHPGWGADQVQPQPPKPAGVGRAVAVVGPAGQVGAFDGGPRPAAFDWGGVGDPDVVEPEVAVGGQLPDHLLDQRQGRAQPLVVAGL